jgi:hypothetical protein
MSPISLQMCCQAIPKPFPPEKQFEGSSKPSSALATFTSDRTKELIAELVAQKAALHPE